MSFIIQATGGQRAENLSRQYSVSNFEPSGKFGKLHSVSHSTSYYSSQNQWVNTVKNKSLALSYNARFDYSTARKELSNYIINSGLSFGLQRLKNEQHKFESNHLFLWLRKNKDSRIRSFPKTIVCPSRLRSNSWSA